MTNHSFPRSHPTHLEGLMSRFSHPLALVFVFALTSTLGRAATPQPAHVAGYTPAAIPAAIAPALIAAQVEVVGQPRVSKGHPCTIWDEEDLAHYKAMLKTSQELQAALADVREASDKRLGEPLNIPEPRKGPDGKWLYPGEYFPPHPLYPGGDAGVRFRARVSGDCDALVALGAAYALTGQSKYGQFARKLLLAYANGFPHYGPPASYNLRYGQGILSQLLDEGLMLTKLSFAYDQIYNLLDWTPEERQQIHDGLLGIVAYEILYPGAPDVSLNNSYGTQENNRGVLTLTGVLAAGYATDDEELVRAALYGIQSKFPQAIKQRYLTYPPLKDWIAGTAEQPFGGLLATHIGKCIGADGMWIEGTPGYALYAGCGLVFSAEMMPTGSILLAIRRPPRRR